MICDLCGLEIPDDTGMIVSSVGGTRLDGTHMPNSTTYYHNECHGKLYSF